MSKRSILLPVLVFVLAAFSDMTAVSAEKRPLINCKPVEERTQPEGCWIVASARLGELDPGDVYWTLDMYQSLERAGNANKKGGTVVQALGKIWLFTVGPRPALSPDGKRVREIGPLPIKSSENYTAQFMEGILEPGAVSRTHVHSGPEAFFTESGESCLETPAGRQVGRNGVDLVIPEGTPMELVASGTETRRGIILVLHSSDRPATSVTTDWKSKGLCFGDR